MALYRVQLRTAYETLFTKQIEGPPKGGPFPVIYNPIYLSNRFAFSVSVRCPAIKTTTQMIAAIRVNTPGADVLANIYMGPSTTLQEASSYGNMMFFLLSKCHYSAGVPDHSGYPSAGTFTASIPASSAPSRTRSMSNIFRM